MMHSMTAINAAYGQDGRAWRRVMALFDRLPLVAYVPGTAVFCHGGLGPAFRRIRDVKKIDRKREPRAGVRMREEIYIRVAMLDP